MSITRIIILLLGVSLSINLSSQNKLINAGNTGKMIGNVKKDTPKKQKTPSSKNKKITQTDERYKTVGYMEISGISFANTDYNGSILDDYGADLYAGELKYLSPRLFYRGLANSTKKITLKIKIIREDGTIMHNQKTKDYTFQQAVEIKPGIGKSIDLLGWGNNQAKSYSPGQYKYEIWYNGNILFQKGFRIYAGKIPTLTSKIIKINNIAFRNVDYNNNMISDYGETLYENEIEYLQAKISYEGLTANDQNITLMIRITLPDGNMTRGTVSPYGFTTKTDLTIHPGNNTATLVGWGNKNKTLYKKGNHLYEIWLNGNKIYETTIEVKAKEEKGNSPQPLYTADGQKIENTQIVDLGLSSGTKWAGWNIGGEKPEDYGGYYSWGELNTKSTYSWDNYFDVKNINKENVTFVIYSSETRTSIIGGYNDVARVQWGENWQMPSKKQIDELLKDCEWHWTNLNGVNGFAVKGPNGKAIFMPAAGCYFNAEDNRSKGETCFYWCGELDTSKFFKTRAACLIMSEDYPKYYDRNGDRCDGKSVRAVYKNTRL